MIKYVLDKNFYIIKDLGEGTGTFIKIEKQVILRNGHIISFGDSHMVIGLVLEKVLKPPEDSSRNGALSVKSSSKAVEKALQT
jgi:pSer/pThr/pTyr-binding forkhead associated (FHA) protein